MRRFARGFTVALLLVGIATAPVAANATIDAQTNTYRVANGRPALVTNAQLTAVAATRARQISTTFTHPSDWSWMFSAVSGCWKGMGENIGWYSPASAAPSNWPVQAWIDSPAHRDLMLGTWSAQASATYVGTDGRLYAVQLFAQSCWQYTVGVRAGCYRVYHIPGGRLTPDWSRVVCFSRASSAPVAHGVPGHWMVKAGGLTGLYFIYGRSISSFTIADAYGRSVSPAA